MKKQKGFFYFHSRKISSAMILRKNPNLVFDTSCSYACGYQEPYGFVPEDGCPIHDDGISYIIQIDKKENNNEKT